MSSLQTPNSKLQTIAIPIVAGIGNAIMAEPMVRQLAAAGHRVTIFAQTGAMGEIFRRIDGVDVIVTGKGLQNRLRAIKQTRALRADVYLVPFPSNRWQYNVLAAASGAKRVIMHGYPVGHWKAMAFLHRDRVPAERGLHDVTQNLRLLERLSLPPHPNDAPRFIINEADQMAANTLLDGCAICDHFVIIHAGSATTILAEAKRWPSDQYARLAKEIADESHFNVLVVEGPDEAGVSEEIVRLAGNHPRVRGLRLACPIGVTAAVLARSSFYVGTDSGLAHLAAAVGKRAVTLFAPADPDRVCPFGNRDLVVQPPDLKTPPFLYPWSATKPKLPAGAEQWIKTITVDQVMETVRKVAAEVSA